MICGDPVHHCQNSTWHTKFILKHKSQWKRWIKHIFALKVVSTDGLRLYVLWASYQIRKIAGCACAGNAGKVFPHRRFQRKPLVSDPGMHHGTCVTHVPWCMSGSLTCGDGENVPGIPRACAPAILRIWQEAHGTRRHTDDKFQDMQLRGYQLFPAEVGRKLKSPMNWAVATEINQYQTVIMAKR